MCACMLVISCFSEGIDVVVGGTGENSSCELILKRRGCSLNFQSTAQDVLALLGRPDRYHLSSFTYFQEGIYVYV